MIRKPHSLPYGEQTILDLIRSNPDTFTCRMLVDALESTPGSVKVMICRLRSKGYAITSPRFRSRKGKRLGVPQTYRLEGDPK